MATRMAFLTGLLERLRLRRRTETLTPDANTPQTAGAAIPTDLPPGPETPKDKEKAQPQAKAWSVEEARLVFGMRWSPISEDASLGTQLKQARRTGYAYQMVSQQGSTVGVIGPLSNHSVGAVHSVAMVLAEHFSTSGAELFVFEHEGQFGLVGLADNNPTPGFDAQGSREDIEALADEYMAMNTGQSIRLVGNVDWLPDMTDLQPTQVADRANKRSQLRVIQNPNLKIALAVLTLLVVGGLGFAYYTLEIIWRQRLAEQNAKKNTNALYEEGISAALSGVGPSGNGRLSPWRETLKTVPMEVAGWELQSLLCKADKCNATWTRVSGNFAEFDGYFPYASKQRPKLVPAEKNEQMLETEHPIPAQPSMTLVPPASNTAPGLQRADLPNVRNAYLQWGSFILDSQLLPQQAASLNAATLFGGEGPLEEINKPVLRGNWQLESDLWTLKDLRLPPYVVAESLTVSRAAGNVTTGGSGSSLGALLNKNLGYRYKIEGGFYANAR